MNAHKHSEPKPQILNPEQRDLWLRHGTVYRKAWPKKNAAKTHISNSIPTLWRNPKDCNAAPGMRSLAWALPIIPLKYIEYGVYGDLVILYPQPYSIYLRGTTDSSQKMRLSGTLPRAASAIRGRSSLAG